MFMFTFLDWMTKEIYLNKIWHNSLLTPRGTKPLTYVWNAIEFDTGSWTGS